MVNVYMVDGSTRIRLTGSLWARQVLDSLSEKGHQVRDLGQAQDPDTRGPVELDRMDVLLESIGL
jgi:hypothetical protein